MEKRIDVNIPCGELMLEGVLEYPNDKTGKLPAAVICHPHPLFGGNMHNNVVRAVRKGLLERGFVCLRFNFRGTGGSWGAYTNGIGELEDVKAAVDFIISQDAVDGERLLVAGYSFGCWVGMRAGHQDVRLKNLIGISPPLNEYDYDFLENETRPKFLIVGDNDFVCSVDNFKKLLNKIPEPKTGIILPNTDHLHIGRENRLVDEINKFLDTYAV